MNNYKVDAPLSEEIVTHLNNMQAVLREVSVTYEVLHELLEQQQDVLSSPVINNLRQDLDKTVIAGVKSAVTIAKQTDELARLSTVVAERIAAIEADL